jgi:hypothetical protein
MSSRRNLEVRKNRRKRQTYWLLKKRTKGRAQFERLAKFDPELATKALLHTDYREVELRVLAQLMEHYKLNNNGDVYSKEALWESSKDWPHYASTPRVSRDSGS